MEFNVAEIYKVPFDNTYKNVVDYHRYTKTGAVLGKSVLTETNIKTARDYFFTTLSPLTIFSSETVTKSVKVVGSGIECSISGTNDTIKDYNYIVFKLLDDTDTVLSSLYCFITSTISNNDGATPSTTIIGEIDFWTNYITDIELNTPQQEERYAHEPNDVYNGKSDDRLPSDFVQKASFEPLYDDIIIFIKVGVDRSVFENDITSSQGRFDPAGGVFDYVYVPFMTITKQAGVITYELITGYQYIDSYGVTQSFDNTTQIKESGYFGFYDYEKIIDAKLTIITPYGIFKASEHTIVSGGKRWFVSNDTVTFIHADNDYLLPFHYTRNNVTYKHYIYHPNAFGNMFSMGCIFKTDNPFLMPTENINEEKTIAFSHTKDIEINGTYSPSLEIKLKQYPYTKKIFSFNNNDYNITPEPTGTTTAPSVTVKLMALNEMALKVQNVTDIANIYQMSIVNDTGIPTSVDAYKAYAAKQMEADMWKLGVSELFSITSAITGIVTGNVPMVIAGASAGAMAGTKYAGNINTLQKTPDRINAPSNNSFDNIYTACPIIKTLTLKPEDVAIVTSVWRAKGYPVHEIRAYATRRFWYDYKQFRNTSLSNITNSLARKKLENVFDNGVTIWHFNRVGNTNKFCGINNYSINNPDNDDCKETT